VLYDLKVLISRVLYDVKVLISRVLYDLKVTKFWTDKHCTYYLCFLHVVLMLPVVYSVHIHHYKIYVYLCVYNHKLQNKVNSICFR